jgi:hypothetical protein
MYAGIFLLFKCESYMNTHFNSHMATDWMFSTVAGAWAYGRQVHNE